MPYGAQVEKALELLSGLDINMIAPSHGLIWRSKIPDILKEYNKWAKYESDNKALIIYDTMWGSTEKIANYLKEGIEEKNVNVEMRNLKTNHISEIIKDVLNSKLILIGSPTLNNNMLPSVGKFLTYLKGLRPKNKIGFVFGSYGWGGQAVGDIEKILDELSWEIPFESINLNYIPEKNELMKVRKIGNNLGEILNK
jgi:flavorubredoxin